MTVRKKPVSSWVLLLWVAVAPSVWAACSGGLKIDTKSCAANTYREQLECLLKQNTMKTVMDCVQLETGGKENVQCRFQDDDFVDDSNGYFQRPIGELSREDFICHVPRRLLRFAARQFGQECGLILPSDCPGNDPSFLNCLCEWHIPLPGLNCLATWFRQAGEKLSCGFSRRGVDHPGEEIDPFGPGEISMMGEEIAKRGLDFRVNHLGQPEFESTTYDLEKRTYKKSTSTGHTLPYRDEIIGHGDQLRRCYIFPSSPDLYCRTHSLSRSWPLPTKTAGFEGDTRDTEGDDSKWIDEPNLSLRSSMTEPGATGMAGGVVSSLTICCFVAVSAILALVLS